MEQLKIQPIKPDFDVPNYSEPYKQIADAMRIRGVTELGEMPRDKERASSLDISREGRVIRTLFVRHLDGFQLEKFHAMEIKHNNFIHDITVLKRHFRLDYPPTILNDARMTTITDFNNDNRPEMRKEFGITVPPYFPLDNEFDGMEYHHAWDKAVRINDLELPEIKSSKKTAKSILYDE